MYILKFPPFILLLSIRFKPFARAETYTKPPQKEVSNDAITKFDSAVSMRWPFIKIDRTSVGKPPAPVEPVKILLKHHKKLFFFRLKFHTQRLVC